MMKGVNYVALLAALCACAIFNHSSAEPGGGTFQTFGPAHQRDYVSSRSFSSALRTKGAALPGFLPPRSSGKIPSDGSSSRSYSDNRRPSGRATGISGVFEPLHIPQQLRDPQLYVIDSGSSRGSGNQPAGSLHREPPAPFPSYGPPVGGSHQRRVSHSQAGSIRPAVGPRRKSSSATYQSSLATPSFVAGDSQRRISHHWQGGRSPAYGVIGRPAVVSSSKHAEPSHASLSGHYQASVRQHGDVESAGGFGETVPVAVASSSQGNVGRREQVFIQQTGGANKYDSGSTRSRSNVGDHGRRVITSSQSPHYTSLPSRTSGVSIGNDQGADDFAEADDTGFSGQRQMVASNGAIVANYVDDGQFSTGRQHQQRVYGKSSRFGQHAGKAGDIRLGSHSGTWRTHGQEARQTSVASAEVVMSADAIGQLQSIEDYSKFEQAPVEDNPRLVHADDNNEFKTPSTEDRLDFVKFGRRPGHDAGFSSNQRHSDDVDSGFQIAKRDEQFEKDDDQQRRGGGQRKLSVDSFLGPHSNDGVSSGSFGVARVELEKFGARKTSAIAEDAEDEVMTINRHGSVCGTRICGLQEACALINGVPVCVASNHHGE